MNPFKPYERQFSNQDRKVLLAASLKNFRRAKGYNQKEVAELLGISTTTYSGYERAASEPDIETLVRISYLFGVSVDVLLQRDFLGTDPTIAGTLKSYKEQHDDMIQYFKDRKQPHVVKLIQMIDKFSKQLEKAKANLPPDIAEAFDAELSFNPYANDQNNEENNEKNSDENKKAD